MSWFSQVSQGPYQRQAADGQQFTAPNILGSPSNPASLPAGAATPATQSSSGAGRPSPGQFDLPSAPQGAASPPSLENLSCAGQDRQPEPISYVTFQEQRCVLSWFQGWNDSQKERFLQDLVGKAVPGKVCTLLDSLSTLQVLPALLQVNMHFLSWHFKKKKFFVTGQRQTAQHLWVPAPAVDPVVWVLGGRGEESFPAHAGGEGPHVCCPLLQERCWHRRKRLTRRLHQRTCMQLLHSLDLLQTSYIEGPCFSGLRYSDFSVNFCPIFKKR